MINFNLKLAKAFNILDFTKYQSNTEFNNYRLYKLTDASKRKPIGFRKQTILIILVSIPFYAKHGKKSIRQQLLDNLAYQ